MYKANLNFRCQGLMLYVPGRKFNVERGMAMKMHSPKVLPLAKRFRLLSSSGSLEFYGRISYAITQIVAVDVGVENGGLFLYEKFVLKVELQL